MMDLCSAEPEQARCRPCCGGIDPHSGSCNDNSCFILDREWTHGVPKTCDKNSGLLNEEPVDSLASGGVLMVNHAVYTTGVPMVKK